MMYPTHVVRYLGKCSLGKNLQENGALTLGNNVVIGNNVSVDGDCTIGSDTIIGHNVTLAGSVKMGSGNWIYPNCTIGTEPQEISINYAAFERMRKEMNKEDNPPVQGGMDGNVKDGDDHDHDKGRVEIGCNNILREGTNVHMPTAKLTSIGNSVYIMNNNTVPHDCIIGDGVRIADNVSLGGHVQVHRGSFLGFGSNIHQYTRIGCYAMIAMGCNITKDVPPFCIINKNQFTKINGVGLQRSGVSADEIQGIKRMYERLPAGLDSPPAAKWYEKEVGGFIKSAGGGPYYHPPEGKIPIKDA